MRQLSQRILEPMRLLSQRILEPMRLLSQRILAAKGVEPADQAKTALMAPTKS